jgi:hypothetical protein
MSLTTSAQFRSDTEMRNAAERILGHNTTRSSTGTQLLRSDDALAVYGNDRGFVVTARDKRQRAVIGYSFTKFDEATLPCGLRWWLNASNKALKENTNGTSTRLMAPLQRASYSVVEPFITTIWNQDRPYNYECPKVESTGLNCMTGCVATALAQAMYYYKYPEGAKFKATYYVDSEEKTKSVNSTYKWASMKDNYASTEKRLDESVKAVGTLMRDCGYASEMDYSANGSSAYEYAMAPAIYQVFQYDSLALRYFNREYYSDDEWYDIVYTALENRQPVLFGGSTENYEGHEFLLCGINSDGLVYVNWGWGGNGDGYFDMNAPRYYSKPFSQGQSVIVGMRPQKTPDNQDYYQSMWVADSINFIVSDNPDTLWIQTPYLFNYSLLQFDGTVDVTLVDKSNHTAIRHLTVYDTNREPTIHVRENEYNMADNEDEEDGEEDNGPIGPFYGYIFKEDVKDVEEEIIDTICVGGLRDVPEGIYSMYLTSFEKRDSERQRVRVPGSQQIATLKKQADGKILVSNDDVDDITATLNSPMNGRKCSTNVYSLSGHLFTRPVQRGVYIVNGRKIIR